MELFSRKKPIESYPGASVLTTYDSEVFVSQYLKSRGLLRCDVTEVEGSKEPHYKSDEQLWKDVINKKDIFESRKLFLDEFALLEWVPRAPGQYYTPDGELARKEAHNYIIERSDGFVVFDPRGKAQMVRGGVGCLRLAMKSVGGEQLKFLCATRSGVAHKGFVVAMRPHIYSKIAEFVETRGAVIGNIVGQVRYWPADESLPFYSEVGIPRIYILVEDIRVVDSSLMKRGKLDVTAAVTFKGEVEGRKGRYFTYAHFDPVVPESITDCVNWLRVNYVEKRYSGKVLTDFDEHIPHFPNAMFPVKILMDPNISSNVILKICTDEFKVNCDLANINIEKYQVERNIVTNMEITGDGNVIGNNNIVVTKINKGLMGSDLRELGEAFALFRGEVMQLQSVPEKVKNQAVRAVEDAEEEAADKSPNSETIEKSLTRAKEVLEVAGETYDKAKGWGKRLYDLGNVLVKIIPAAAVWISKLLG